MKTAVALINACAALSFVAARQMHAGINYQRYLQEERAIEMELDDWMSKFEGDAEVNGWLPQTESRSADEVYEDRKQRFFMAKELVSELSEQNPDAVFTTDSPFSLLTTDEFSAYIKNSYLAGEQEERRLRANHQRYSSDESAASNGNARAHSFNFAEKFTEFFNKAWKNKMPATDDDSEYNGEMANEGDAVAPSSNGQSFSFQEIMDWINSNRQPNKPPSTDTPSTSRPRRTARPTDAPSSAPSPPTTYAPTPQRTNAPSTPRPTSGPVAPTDAPNQPVGPVAPPSAPGSAPAPAPTGDSAAEGTGMNWSKHKCMAPIQNQGQCGSCWAFATISTTETGMCIAKGGTLTKLSEQNVASCDTRNSGCNGGAIFYAMSYIQKSGVCTMADDPYTSGRGTLSGCNSSCKKVATGVTSNSRVQGEAGLVTALNTAPVTIAVAAGNTAWKQYRSGVISTCQTSQVDHAVVAVGYDATSFILRNSWGANWGEAGYVRLKRGACSMYQDMSQPKF